MKEGFDLKQAFTFNKKRHLSLIFAVILLIVFVAVRFGISWELSRRIEAEKPQLALKTLIAELRQYKTAKKKFPLSFDQLKSEIWEKKNKQKNLIGQRYFSENNYVYYYSSDEKFCSIWAIPEGKYRESAETVFVLLNDANQEIWRGQALSVEQKQMIPGIVRPPLALMAQFNMNKDVVEQKAESKSSTFFPSFDFQK